MTTLSSFTKTDLVDDHQAAHINALIGAVLRAEYKNTETITATKQLVDNDTQYQLITASGANRDVRLAAEATTNHVTIVLNNGGSNNVLVKDDSGGTTFATLEPGEWCMAIPMGGVSWKVIDSNALVGGVSASTTVQGIVELATAAETTTGTDATRAVTPDGLAGSDYGIKAWNVEVFSAAAALSTGDGKKYIAIPAALAGFNLIRLHAILFAKSTSGTPTIQIARGRRADAVSAHTFVDVLSTLITVDANEFDSRTAATAPVINTSNDDLADGDLLRVDVDVAGTAATGLWITFEAQKP